MTSLPDIIQAVGCMEIVWKGDMHRVIQLLNKEVAHLLALAEVDEHDHDLGLDVEEAIDTSDGPGGIHITFLQDSRNKNY